MITFIGTSHIDPDGRENLARALKSAAPEIILLEVSMLSVILRQSLGRIYRYVFSRNFHKTGVAENRELLTIRNYLGLPCEYGTVKAYCRQSGARYRLIDSSLVTLLRYPAAWRLVKKKNIETAAGIDDDRYARERAVAARVIGGSDPLLARGDTPAFRSLSKDINTDRVSAMRESILVRRVKKALARHRGRHIAFVGGWEHCTDDPGKRVLYARIDGPKERIIIFL